MPSWSELNDCIKLFLKDLQPSAQRVARLVCFTYWLKRDPQLNAELRSQRAKAARVRKALRKLDRGLRKLRAGVESTLQGEIEALNDEIRAAHIPYGSFALLPFVDDPGLASYFHRKGLPDPAETLERFLALWPGVQRLASREVLFIQIAIPKMAGLWKKEPQRFWLHGAARVNEFETSGHGI
jgi:hypothetical protein